MMRSLKGYAAFLTVGVLACTHFFAAMLAQANEAVRLSFVLQAPIVTLHEAVLIDFSIRNESNQEIRFDLGSDCKGNFDFTIMSPDGRAVQAPHLIRDGVQCGGRRSLAPQGTYRQQLLFNEWYQFPAPGQYQLIARLSEPIMKPGGIPLQLPPTALSLEILPRNTQRLEQVAQQLTDRVLDPAPSSLGDIGDALNVLSHIADPIVVPYLRRVLLEGPRWMIPTVAPSTAIPALQRLANAEAIDTLIEVVEAQHKELAPYAAAALKRIRDTTPHAEFKQKIDAVLARTEKQQDMRN